MRPNSWTWLGQKNFPFCYSQSALLTDLPPPPLEQKWFETGLQCKHRVRKLKSENCQNYAQKPQRNCTFMNSASVLSLTLFGVTHKSILRKMYFTFLKQKNVLKSYTKWSSPTYQETITQYRKMQGKNVQAVIITLFRCSSVRVVKKADLKIANNTYKIF